MVVCACAVALARLHCWAVSREASEVIALLLPVGRNVGRVGSGHITIVGVSALGKY